jgi:hypothetical protein
MSAQEIIAELPKLKPDELRLVKAKVDDLAKAQRRTIGDALLEVAGTAAGSNVEPPKKSSEPQKTPAQILAEIAALSERHGAVETASMDHDEVLYGWKRAK